jgi:hypothetical protein
MLRVFYLLAIATFTSICADQKVVLFNDTSAWYHWGCTGTSAALKEGIQKLGFDIEVVPINVTYALQAVPEFEEFDDPQKFDRFCEKNRDTIEAIRDAVAVVIAGEGTIHDLRAAPKALLYLAHISKKFFDKHVEIINHSAYPKDDPSLAVDFLKNFEIEKKKTEQELERAQAIYKTLYAELDFIAIREPFSRDEMSKINISSTLSFDCLPLYIRDHYRTKKQVNEKTLVIAGSVAFSETGAEKLCRYLETMAATGFEIKVLVGAAAFPAKDDQSFINFLKTHCKTPWKLIIASSMEEWLDTINHSTLLVSGRFHHSIAAFCLNTPFIALNSNTRKVHALCSLLGQVEPLLFSDPHLLDHLLLRTDAIFSSPRVNNDVKVAEICQLAERNFDGLKSFAAENASSTIPMTNGS